MLFGCLTLLADGSVDGKNPKRDNYCNIRRGEITFIVSFFFQNKYDWENSAVLFKHSQQTIDNKL